MAEKDAPETIAPVSAEQLERQQSDVIRDLVSQARKRYAARGPTHEPSPARAAVAQAEATPVAGALAGGDRGFRMSVLPGVRAVRGYPVTKGELEQIGEAQTQTQTFYALGSFFASFALSAFLDAVLSLQLTPAGHLLNTYGPWVFGLLAAAFGYLGYASSRRRNTLIDSIVAETKHQDGPPEG